MPTKLAPLAALSVVLAAVVGAYVVAPDGSSPDQRPLDDHQRPPDSYGFGPPDAGPPTPEAATMTTFDSAAEFTEYVWTARMQTGGHAPRVVADGGEREVQADTGTGTAAPEAVSASKEAAAAGGGAPDRYSGTNVQEQGIDEPDVVKTDGQHIYYAERTRGHRHPAKRRDGDDGDDGETRIVDATPPGTADLAARIGHSGRLLLAGDRLVVIGEKVWGYDVSNASDPDLEWTRNLSERVQTARLRNGTLYLVLASRVDAEEPCPVEPLEGASVECTEVYHPRRPVRVDVTYTALTLDPATGDIGDELSFVGARDATIYMSHDGLYATYTEETPRASVQLDFLLTDARPLLDDWVVNRLEEVRGYDLSPRATGVEVRQTLERWFRSLDEERREDVQRELRERFEEYVEANKRDLTTTHVVRIETSRGAADGTGARLSMAGTGAVPGRPLNQFSLDEHEDHLRIATTVGERWGTESVNDVYVLDASNLSVTGSVTGMGETERIYAVRFVGDRGYVVTFRRIDPFHVLDLSDPSDPTMEGELKLPGYSSYLHPLPGDRVLGIGEEDGEVKAVIFDVSDPAKPTIEESRVLAADWSAIARTHHAFLLDERHGVFFLPTEHGGKVLSSTSLDTVHTVAVDDPRRALYIDDYLYVFGDNEVAVVNENNWTRVETLDLG